MPTRPSRRARHLRRSRSSVVGDRAYHSHLGWTTREGWVMSRCRRWRRCGRRGRRVRCRGRGRRHPVAVVGDCHGKGGVGDPEVAVARCRRGWRAMLVRASLAKVRRGLHRCREPLVHVQVGVGRRRGSVGEFVYCGGETVVGEDLGVDAAHGSTRSSQASSARAWRLWLPGRRRSARPVPSARRQGQGDEGAAGYRRGRSTSMRRRSISKASTSPARERRNSVTAATSRASGGSSSSSGSGRLGRSPAP